MADRVTNSTASIRRGLNQHGCERIVLPSHIRVQSTKLTDISFVAYTDGLCPLCMVYQSSIVILDDGSAANLPAIPGRFIIRNGSETDDIVQAYYYHK